jgi:hypothetical protein
VERVPSAVASAAHYIAPCRSPARRRKSTERCQRGVGRREEGHDGLVGDIEAVETLKPQIGVDDIRTIAA